MSSRRSGAIPLASGGKMRYTTPQRDVVSKRRRMPATGVQTPREEGTVRSIPKEESTMKRNSSPDKVRRSPGKVKRREFLGRTAAGAAIATGASIFGGQPPAFAQSREVHYLQWSSFIPDADVDIKRQCREFEKASGVKVKEELINQERHDAAPHRGDRERHRRGRPRCSSTTSRTCSPTAWPTTTS